MKPFIISAEAEDDTRATLCRTFSKDIAHHIVTEANAKGLTKPETLTAVCITHVSMMAAAGASRKDAVAIYDELWEEVERALIAAGKL